MKQFLKSKFKKGDTEKKEKRKEPKAPKREISGERKIRFSKLRVQKIVSWTLIILIITSLFFNVVFFSQYSNINADVSAQQEEVEQQLNQVADNETYESDKVVFYAEEFLRDYINVAADEDTRNEDFQALEKYFHNGFDINDLYNVNDFNGSRDLNTIKYVERSIDSNEIIDVVFEVSYTLTSEPSSDERDQMRSDIRTEKQNDDDVDSDDVDEEVEEEFQTQLTEQTSTTDHTTLIALPIQAVNEGYAIIDNPREVSDELYQNLQEDDVQERDYQGQSLNQGEISELDTIFSDFFTAYGQDDENVRLISNFDNGIGNKEYIEHEVNEAYEFEEEGENKVTAVVDVDYQDNDSNMINTYTYEVTLIDNDDRYIVDEIR